MTRTLLRGFDLIATMDDERHEIEAGYVLVEGNRIVALGEDSKEIAHDLAIEGEGKVLLPGFVNTHHHLYQTLFRNVPGAADKKLFDWLIFLYERWKGIDEEAVRTSAAIGCSELLLSGATTTSDHFYLFPRGLPRIFDAEVEGGILSGIRFHPTRGSMSLSKKDGGLPPDSVVQTEDEILADCQRVIERYHDPSPCAMLRVALAPCSPFSVTSELMRETTKLADEYGVLLHTHLAETADEDAFCLEKFGARPVDYMEELGWLRDGVWFAHLVHLSDSDIDKLSTAKVGMSHCPSSNMTLGSGIAPVVPLKTTGVTVSLGVDGSASNDSSNMIREVRQAMLLQRVRYGADALTAREALYLATMGGARVLHREEEIGSIEVGKAADLIAFDTTGIEFAGAHADPLAALVHCGANRVDLVMVNGEVRVRDGRLVDESLYKLIPLHNAISRRLISG
ncbi:MAG: 8-oxoguanine deaminase [Candidatus Bipolaricaulota bacterium]|nr:8-oxoguanine deaminase [Candidatus Bipolaricaulota bacterium]